MGDPIFCRNGGNSFHKTASVLMEAVAEDFNLGYSHLETIDTGYWAMFINIPSAQTRSGDSDAK